MNNRLAQRAAIITGAARGIGQATARLFAREGASVGLIDRDSAGLDKAAGELAHGIETDRYVSLQFTRAQKSDAGSYRAGQVLVFHRATKNIAKHQALEVVRVLDRKIVARSEEKCAATFDNSACALGSSGY